MNIIIPIIFIILLLLFILFSKSFEKFTVDFIPYKDPYFGFCYPGLSKEQWESGNFQTRCWNNFSYEDCELLNQNGYNCGYDLKTGKKLKCVHNINKCKDESQCFSTCFNEVGPCKGPYMIEVKANNLIGLEATQ